MTIITRDRLMRRTLSITLSVFITILAMLTAQNSAIAEQKPILQLDSGGHLGTIRDVIYTPDGKFLVSAGDDKVIRVWDVRTGKTVRTIRGEIGDANQGKIFSMAMSPDGNTLAVGGWFVGPPKERDAIRLYDLYSGELIDLMYGHRSVVFSLAFSSTGDRLVSSGADKSAIIWDVPNRRVLHRLEGHSQTTFKVAFTKDDQRVVTASYDGTLRMWSVANGRSLRVMRGHRGRVISLAISPVDGTIASGGHDNVIRFWNGRSGQFLQEFGKMKTHVGSLTFSSDGLRLLAGSFKSSATNAKYECAVFDVINGSRVHTYQGHGNNIVALTITPDGQTATTAGGSNHEIHLWDLETGRVDKKLKSVGAAIWGTGFVNNGRAMGWGRDILPRWTHNNYAKLKFQMRLPSQERPLGQPQKVKSDNVAPIMRTKFGAWSMKHRPGGRAGRSDAILDIFKNKKKIASIERGSSSGFSHSSYTFTPDGKTIVSAGGHGELISYTRSGKRIGSYIGHGSTIWSVNISPDGRFMISGGNDQTVRLWNFKTRELIITLFHATNGEWVAWTPQGYYSASTDGDRYVGWQINRGKKQAATYILAAQMKSTFYRPDIIEQAIRIGSAKAAVRNARGTRFALKDLTKRKPPIFRILNPGNSNKTTQSPLPLAVKIAKNDDPVKRFEVSVNGRVVTTRAMRGLARVQRDEHDRTLNIPLTKGENIIKITAFNDIGKTVHEMRIIHEGIAKSILDKKGTLYLVAIGVDKYPSLGNDLTYAGADAKAFHDLYIKQARKLHKSVKSQLLTNDKGGEQPTKDNIEDALDMFSDAGPEDTVVLFMAGHGVNDRENYYFLPTDARLRKKRWRASSVVKWSLLSQTLASARGRRIMMIDTCKSGNAFNSRLLKDAADANIVVFSATNSETLAQEQSQLGHGVFTYALLQGLSGKADLIKDAKLSVLELGSYLSNEVKKLTNNDQQPTFHVTGATDFILAGF